MVSHCDKRWQIKRFKSVERGHYVLSVRHLFCPFLTLLLLSETRVADMYHPGLSQTHSQMSQDRYGVSIFFIFLMLELGSRAMILALFKSNCDPQKVLRCTFRERLGKLVCYLGNGGQIQFQNC